MHVERANIHMHARTHARTHAHTHTHARTNTRTRAHKHTHTHRNRRTRFNTTHIFTSSENNSARQNNDLHSLHKNENHLTTALIHGGWWPWRVVAVLRMRKLGPQPSLTRIVFFFFFTDHSIFATCLLLHYFSKICTEIKSSLGKSMFLVPNWHAKNLSALDDEKSPHKTWFV